MLQYIIAGLINPLRHLSGPWHTRFSGLSLKAATLAGRRIHYVHALHEQYGRYVRISPSEVAVMDPAGFQRIHALSAGFEKTKWYQEMVLMERPGIFSMSGGKTHSDRRRLLSRPFSKSLLRQTWEPTVRHYTEAAVTRMLDERSEKSKNKNVDILKWWTFMASDISAHLMFGESFHTMESGKVSRYTQLLQNALKGGGIGAELPWLRAICSRIPLRVFQDAFNGNTELMQYGEAAVRNMKAADGGSNIFSNMLRQAQDGELLDERDVQVEATNLIVAGTDTTAITLTYLVWAVLSRPALQAALVAELETLSENHSDADLERLPLLNGVVKETLRLYGAAPGGLPRAVPAGGIELGGFRFPAGSTLTTQSFSLHRDPTLFPSPEEYASPAIGNQAMLLTSLQVRATSIPSRKRMVSIGRRESSLFAFWRRRSYLLGHTSRIHGITMWSSRVLSEMPKCFARSRDHG